MSKQKKRLRTFYYERIILSGEKDQISLHYDIPVQGRYYMILAMCDPATANFNITGETVVMNPFGHIPGLVYMECFHSLVFSWLHMQFLLSCGLFVVTDIQKS